MGIDTIENDFRKKVCEKVRLASEGVNRYRVFTPFMFEDGDHLAIVLKKEQNGWFLSDEGHTYMHLTYELDEKTLQKGTRARIITNALSAFSVDDREGELVMAISEGGYGDALYSYIQALLKISDVTYLSRERVRSAFLEDFKAFIDENVPESRRTYQWHDPVRDPERNYVVDCRVNGMTRPLFIYALPGDDKVRDTTIAIHQFERWQLACRSMAVFENQEEVNRKVLARFSDVCEKMYSNLAGNKDRIHSYLIEAMG